MKRNTNKYDVDKLLFRRQFIIGPRFVEPSSGWRRTKIRDELLLTSHTDLPVYQVSVDHRSLTLLGFILDPNNPEATDSEIIENLFGELKDHDGLEKLFEYTYIFGGRWILIADDNKEIRLFNDAVGYRQIFYTDLSFCDELWCASQPGIVADLLNFQMGHDSLEFLYSNKSRSNWQYWWPGTTSPYREIKHLLPNHYIDLQTGVNYRYWPKKPIDRLSLEEAVDKNSNILRGLMQSASNRFDLALSITSGRDTRVILAASKDISDKLYCFTMLYWDLNEDSPDVAIPRRLLSKLGLKHNIIRCPSYMERDFKKLYERNVSTAREIYGTIAQGLYNSYPQDKVCLKGNAIPIGKCIGRERLRNRGKPSGVKVTADDLAWLATMDKLPFAIKSCEKWLAELNEIYNIDVLDLFWWENKEPNWQAMSQLEWDIVQEVLVPFNCRSFLSNMLAVDPKYRKGPEFKFHQALITNMWPELLHEPVNPEPNRRTLKAHLKSRIQMDSLLRRLKSLKYRFILKISLGG